MSNYAIERELIDTHWSIESTHEEFLAALEDLRTRQKAFPQNNYRFTICPKKSSTTQPPSSKPTT